MILVTGAAGFMGFHLSKKLLDNGEKVIGIDNLNNYYDQGLKNDRLQILNTYHQFEFEKIDLCDKNKLTELFRLKAIQYVVNLAAQAGVRYSLENPRIYIDSNINGFLNILELCRYNQIKHLIFASSSSVYGANTLMPFSVHQNVDHPISLYAATKKSNELMAHAYAHLYGMPITGLRFFTVYGPYGRPDMALFLFTKAIIEGKAINVFNNGQMQRDFTYVDDVVAGIERLIHKIPSPNENWNGDNPDPSTSFAPYKIYNIGNNNPVKLMDFIEVLEAALQKKAIKKFLPLQPGDVLTTFADVEDLVRDIGFKPNTSIERGIQKFVEWYLDYYNVKINQ